MSGFGRRLADAVSERGPLCPGIDPHPELLRAWGEVRMVVFALLVIAVARGYPAGLYGVWRALAQRLAARVPALAPALVAGRPHD